MSNIVNFSTFSGPISTIARMQAEKWSKQQFTPKKSQQVLLNTLSVSFVDFYLKCMGFTTELEANESWNPVQQTLMDVADLSIKNLGKLECRPIQQGEKYVYIPPEVQSSRIGYVAVRINESLQSAELLGFIQEASIDSIPINQLQSLEDFLKYLENLKFKTNKLSEKKCVNLTRWFENIFSEDWQIVESIFFQEPALQFRINEDDSNKSVQRAKVINCNINYKQESVVIIVNLNRNDNKCDEINIVVGLHPIDGKQYLPPLISIMLLDDEETVVMEAKAKSDNKKIELEFSASPGDCFSIKIVLGDVSVIEDFIV